MVPRMCSFSAVVRWITSVSWARAMAIGLRASIVVGLDQERLSTCEVSSWLEMQKLQSGQLGYGLAVIRSDIAVGVGRGEGEALRWSLSSIG